MELVLENLEKRYGDKTVLQIGRLVLREGLCGILGENGAGKSTLMNLITDNITRTGGQIRLDGKEILSMGKEYRKLIGFMPQEQGFYESFSGRMFLRYMAELKEVPRRAAAAQTEELLRVVSLADVAHHPVREYSGGMRQRLMFAQALLGDPKILLLDEPTAGLDPGERINLRCFIQRLAADRIILLATHIVSDVETAADRVILMRQGCVAADGTVPEILASVEQHVNRPVTGKLSLEDAYLYYSGRSRKEEIFEESVIR